MSPRKCGPKVKTRRQRDYLTHLAAGGPMSEVEFADHLGMTDRTLWMWRADPIFLKAVEAHRKDIESRTDRSVFIAATRMIALEHQARIMSDPNASGTEQAKASGRILDMTKDYEEPGVRVDLTELSDEDLIAQCLELDDATKMRLTPDLKDIERRMKSLPDAPVGYRRLPQDYLDRVTIALGIDETNIEDVIEPLLVIFDTMARRRGRGESIAIPADEKEEQEGAKALAFTVGEAVDVETGEAVLRDQRAQRPVDKKHAQRQRQIARAKKLHAEGHTRRQAYAMAFRIKAPKLTDEMLAEVWR